MGKTFKAIRDSEIDLEIYVKYDDKTSNINVYHIAPTFNVQLNRNTLTYNGNELSLAKVVFCSDGIKSFFLGYKKGSEATGNNDITWGVVNTASLKATDAGTYYIYYKYSVKPDIYGGDKPYTLVGNVTINPKNAEAEVNEKNIDIPYSINSQKIELGEYVESTSGVSFYNSVKVTYPDKAKSTWECTPTGTVTIPGGTKGSSKDFVIEVNVTATGDGENVIETKDISLKWYLKIGYSLINITAEDDSDSDFDYVYPDYERLDDDVSFQIMRTNPKLTTNTKLLYDGKNMYMESYPAAPILTTENYKHFKVYSTGLFNKDLRKFLIGTDKTAYTIGQDVSDSIVLNNFDNQFENMYWCGVESINSDVYPQEMGCVAPLYLRRKRPNYFVIFKIDTPVNINYVNGSDMTYDFEEDILGKKDPSKKARIIKAFDLREGTPIGNYIKRYIEQKMFEYDRSIYVNFSSNEIYYYGIDKGTGVLTQKVENFEEQLLHNDNTIMKMDDWITSGFERNNLIFPYIINFEFLFDDKEIGEYKFARYFGMYCNDIDLDNLDISSMIYSDGKTNIIENWENEGISDIKTSENEFYYIKDKNRNIYSIKSLSSPGYYQSPTKLDINDFTGFELTSVSTYAERISGTGHATMILDVYDKIEDGDTIRIIKPIISESSESDESDEVGEIVLTLTASENLDEGSFDQNTGTFSCAGKTTDTIEALVGLINASRGDEFELIYAYSIDNKVIIESIYSGSNMNEFISVELDGNTSKRIEKIMDKFDGGTDVNGCKFKVYTSDLNMFFDYISGENEIDHSRYLRCGVGRNNSRILSSMPYIHDEKIDDTYSVLITDKYGPYVNISNTEEIEVLDKFYSKIGILSFFPVKDFDFDTVSSPYGNDDVLQQEFALSNPEIMIKLDIDEYNTSDNSTNEPASGNESGSNPDPSPSSGSGYTSGPYYGGEVTHMGSGGGGAGSSGSGSESSTNETSDDSDTDTGYIVMYINNVPYGRFFYHNGNTIDTEYEYFFENVIPELVLINKTSPYITKWGYIDDSKDSCENIYRLNTSKIFETCNFSANTYVKGGDIFEYTHSMPYYINNLYDDYYNKNNLKNEYQYIPVNSDLWDVCKGGDYDTIVNTWVSYFLDEDKNNFEKMFGDASATVLTVTKGKNKEKVETLDGKTFDNKRFNKKYSRFLLGNDINRSSTLFRGVKFEIEELDGNKEIHTGKFNGYKFSFIYVPMSNTNENNEEKNNFTVHFIKNDKYKFIVGLVVFNIKSDLKNRVFNKSFVYAGSMYNIK